VRHWTLPPLTGEYNRAMGESMDRSRRVFGSLSSFENVFPTLDDAVVQYTEYDLATEKGHGTHYMRAWGGLMHCGNSRCRRGGYEVDRIVSEMLRENVTEKEFELRCPGDEGTPKGRKRGQRCYRSIKGKVTLKYKTTQDSDVAS
jgi:hypothetical protein